MILKKYIFKELNYVLDRNTYIAYMMASELADQLPSKITDEMTVLLPHTRASFKIQVNKQTNIKTKNFLI